jgi:hypothetical protein
MTLRRANLAASVSVGFASRSRVESGFQVHKARAAETLFKRYAFSHSAEKTYK